MEIKKYFGFIVIITLYLLISYFLISFSKTSETILISPLSKKSSSEQAIISSNQSVQEKTEEEKTASQETVLAEVDEQPQKEKITPDSEPAKIRSVDNTPPSSGYQQQQIQTEQGTFTVDIISADLNSTRVIVDTASDSDCSNDCPVLALSKYVSRNAAFAGINGSYFCPASYSSCADKRNSFDTLLMNKNKKYFNSENNIFSTVPAVIFSGNSARFVTQTLEWGRDTGVDAVIANQPLLVLDGQLLFSGDDDFKRGIKSSRSFIGSTDSTVYIGVVHNATVTESAQVVYNLGINSALNLDSGGSTALWHEGYKVGPGRDIPNAVLLVRK